ncbi:MAG: hypothetical protein WAO55_05085 [Candidatus Manganitrophaceae bacterium]
MKGSRIGIIPILFLLILFGCDRNTGGSGGDTSLPTGWSKSSDLSKGVFYALAADPNDPNVVYAASSVLSVYKTIDGGTTWSAANRGLPAEPVRTLLVDPNAPLRIYAAVAGGELFKTEDGGAIWSQIGQGLAQYTPNTVVYDSIVPSDQISLYVGTGGGGIFASKSNGTSRVQVNTGLGTGDGLDVSILLLDRPSSGTPGTPPVLYAGTRGGVYRSADGGANWVSNNTGLSEPAILSLVMARSTGILYAGTPRGLYKGIADGSAPWVVIGDGATTGSITSIAIDPVDSQMVYAASATAGIFKSIDGGVTWSVVNQGITSPDIRSILIHPQDRNLLYAGGIGAVFKSIDGGNRWTPLAPGVFENISNLLPTASVKSIIATAGGILYAGGSAGVYKSVDQGQGWVPMKIRLAGSEVEAVVSDPLRPGILYTALRNDGIYKSLDGGGSWREENGPAGQPSNQIIKSVTGLLIDPDRPDRLYAGTAGGGVYRGIVGVDGHLSWAPINDGLAGSGVYSLVILPGNPATLFAGTFQEGIFKMVDNGVDAWVPVGGPLFDRSIFALAAHPQILFAGTTTGLYKSEDGGANFSLVENSPAVDLHFITIDPAIIPSGTGILIGTSFGVFKSMDQGAHWASLDDGLTSPTYSILVDPQQNNVVYAGTLANGIFRRRQ